VYLLLTSASRKLLALIKTTSRPSLARCELTSQVFPEIVYILTHNVWKWWLVAVKGVNLRGRFGVGGCDRGGCKSLSLKLGARGCDRSEFKR